MNKWNVIEVLASAGIGLLIGKMCKMFDETGYKTGCHEAMDTFNDFCNTAIDHGDNLIYTRTKGVDKDTPYRVTFTKKEDK